MGTHGTGIFDDDDALEVRSLFKEYLGSNIDFGKATDLVLNHFGVSLESDIESDNCVVILALAATQISYKFIHIGVKRKALEVIESKVDLDRWDVNKALLCERKEILECLETEIKRSDVYNERKGGPIEKGCVSLEKGDFSFEFLLSIGKILAIDGGSQTFYIQVIDYCDKDKKNPSRVISVIENDISGIHFDSFAGLERLSYRSAFDTYDDGILEPFEVRFTQLNLWGEETDVPVKSIFDSGFTLEPPSVCSPRPNVLWEDAINYLNKFFGE